MCGIVGFFTNNDINDLSRDLAEASNRLSHRGPDASGIYIDRKRCVGLGHRRLSIIDLSDAGNQPMESSDGQVVIVYNGEVYNFKTLRSQLQARGYRFQSQTDTEVVLYAFKEWGVECFQRFVGMFAIAIWDRQTNQLTICRDRMGIKPVYYYFDDRTLLFGSELKSLMAFQCFPRRINDDALPMFLHYQYIPAPHTVFEKTHKLPQGTYLQYDGRELLVKTYWDPTEPTTSSPSGRYREEEDLIDELDQLITGAVRDRLVSDVPLGALLSGGIDSSLVVAMMQKVGSMATRTFSIGFGEPQYNEAPWAKKVADHLGTNHVELKVSPTRALNTVQSLPDIFDEPFADSSAIPTFLVSRLTREHVTVALSGDGGDEQFAGYDRYRVTQAVANGFRGLPRKARTILANWLKRIPTRWVDRCFDLSRDFIPRRIGVTNFAEKWQKLLLLMERESLPEIYRMTVCIWPDFEMMDLIGRALQPNRYEAVFRSTAGKSILSRLLLVDQNTYLPDCMLVKVDRASMAAGLEIRVPLLDHRILEFSRGLPDSLKYRSGTGKYILKKVLSRYLPKELFERPKMGFGVPIDRWFRSELKELLGDYLSPDALKTKGRINHVLIERKIREHMSGRRNHHHRLWAILMWEMWCERWL